VFADGFKPARITVLTKRTIDLLVSLCVVVLSSPVMLLIAAAVRLDSPGPVFFRQDRLGRFGRVFRMLKFRSMRADADTSPPAPDAPDPRVTRVGRLLRRTRLDELPQLFNVILGDMSLVGPRPEWVDSSRSSRRRCRSTFTDWRSSRASRAGPRSRTSTVR